MKIKYKMVCYDCIPCGYSTKNKADYKKHKRTNKHKNRTQNIKPSENKTKTKTKTKQKQREKKNDNQYRDKYNHLISENGFTCSFCHSKYRRYDILKEHEKKCKVRKKYSETYEERIEKLEKELERKNIQLDMKDKTITMKNESIKRLRTMVIRKTRYVSIKTLKKQKNKTLLIEDL